MNCKRVSSNNIQKSRYLKYKTKVKNHKHRKYTKNGTKKIGGSSTKKIKLLNKKERIEMEKGTILELHCGEEIPRDYGNVKSLEEGDNEGGDVEYVDEVEEPPLQISNELSNRIIESKKLFQENFNKIICKIDEIMNNVPKSIISEKIDLIESVHGPSTKGPVGINCDIDKLASIVFFIHIRKTIKN